MSKEEKLNFLFSRKPRQAYLERFLEELSEDEKKLHELTVKVNQKRDVINNIQTMLKDTRLPVPDKNATQEEIFKYLIELEYTWLLGQNENKFTQHFIYIEWSVTFFHWDSEGMPNHQVFPMKSKEDAEEFFKEKEKNGRSDMNVTSQHRKFDSYNEYFKFISNHRGQRTYEKDRFIFQFYGNEKQMFIEREKVKAPEEQRWLGIPCLYYSFN